MSKIRSFFIENPGSGADDGNVYWTEFEQHEVIRLEDVENFTVDLCEERKRCAESKIDDWYELLGSEHFKPSISVQKISIFDTDSMGYFRKEISSLEPFVVSAYSKYTGLLECKADKEKEDNLKLTFSALIKYLPEVSRYKTSFFVDDATGSVGLTIKDSGTLTILITGESEFSYTYAKAGDAGGLVRFTGKAKMSKNLKNSHHIRKLLQFTRDM